MNPAQTFGVAVAILCGAMAGAIQLLRARDWLRER